jgi:hypothetical protein
MNTKDNTVIAFFILSQLVLVTIYGQLKTEIVNLRSENQSMSSMLSARFDHSFNSLRLLIDEQNRPIEQASVNFGTFNKEQLTIEVTFNVVPKELTPTTNVFIEFNDEKIQLTRNNSTFSLSKEFSIFSEELFPFIVIEDNEKQIISRDSRLNLYSMRYGVMPMIDVHFGGEYRATFDKSILVDGQIDLFVPISDNLIKLTSYKVLYILDDKVVGRQNLITTPTSGENLTNFNLDRFSLNKALSENSIFTIVFVATNELGLEHEIVLLQSKYQNESSNTEFCYIENIERIYSSTNELLWQSNPNLNSLCVLPSYR